MEMQTGMCTNASLTYFTFDPRGAGCVSTHSGSSGHSTVQIIMNLGTMDLMFDWDLSLRKGQYKKPFEINENKITYFRIICCFILK